MTRLRQLRLARAWTMDRLLAEAGGIVTKAALSKYELGRDQPSAMVANRLASALRVKAIELFSDPVTNIEFTGYRKSSRMTSTECAQTEAAVSLSVEHRLQLANLIGQTSIAFNPYSAAVETGEQAEDAAERLRKHWRLGTDPITAPIACLEANGVQVLDIRAPEACTGLSGIAYDSEKKARAIVVVCRIDQCGERQGLTAVHEVGHVYCRVPDTLSKKIVEKLMFRFSAAFHAPAASIRHAFGERRKELSLSELLVQKRVFRLSMAALVCRLADLGIISDALKTSMFKLFSAQGWKKHEPEESTPEQPAWLRATALRLLSEGVISHAHAARLLGESVSEEPLSLRESREFLRLPVENRRQMLQGAAERSAEYYRRVMDQGDSDVADSH